MQLITTFLFLLSLAFFPSSQFDISVSVEGVNPVKGEIQIGLYNKEDGFMYKETSVSNTVIKVTGATTNYVLEAIPKGKYAIIVFHDANENGFMDKNFLGIPKEGFGFSNNPKCLIGPPKYQSCTFDLSSDLNLSIKLNDF